MSVEWTRSLAFFRAMSDPNRLRMVGLLGDREMGVDELAAALGLRPPTVSHHLSRLKSIGLVSMKAQGTSHLYQLNEGALRQMSQEVLSREALTGAAAGLDAGAWEQKVLRDYLQEGRLKEIPASRKKREVILRWLAGKFDPGVSYLEPGVNEILARFHPDTATLRREMVGHALLQRRDRVYRRLVRLPAEASPPDA